MKMGMLKLVMKNSVLFFVVWVGVVCVRLALAWEPLQLLSKALNMDRYIAILTPDAALYGYYASSILRGLAHESDVHLIEYVIAFLVRVSPWDLDAILYFGPAFFGALIAIPTMGILRQLNVGVLVSALAGMVSGVGYGYYSRSYLGYFDTDVLNTFFPLMVLWGMLCVIEKKKLSHAYWPFLATLLYIGWYHSSLPLLYAMHGWFFLYVVVFHRKEVVLYQSVVIMALALAGVAWWMSVGVAVAFGLLFWKLPWRVHHFFGLFGVAFLGILFRLDLSQIAFHLERYAFKADVFQEELFWFVSPMQHVSEAKETSLEYIIGLLSGNWAIGVLSLVGYTLLVYRHKMMLLGLPLLALGFLSVKAGVRFHIYGVPLLVIGFAYGVWFLCLHVKGHLALKIALVFLLFAMPFYENYKSLNYWNGRVARSVFNPEQVRALQKLNEATQPNDFAVSWWDYGWPLWYYADMRTLIDNGRHFADNYTVASILLSSSQRFSHHATHYFYELYAANSGKDAIVQALKSDVNATQLFRAIEDEHIGLPKVHEKYLVLPLGLLRLGYTLFTFANIDPQTARRGPSHFFKRYQKMGEDQAFMYFDKGMKIDKKDFKVVFEKSSRPLKRFDRVEYRDDKRLVHEKVLGDEGLSLIHVNQDYFLVDEFFYQSALFQMLAYHRYDTTYFEPFYLGKTIAIYKVK